MESVNPDLFDSLNLQACSHVQGIDDAQKNLIAPKSASDQKTINAGKGFALSSFLLNSSAIRYKY